MGKIGLVLRHAAGETLRSGLSNDVLQGRRGTCRLRVEGGEGRGGGNGSWHTWLSEGPVATVGPAGRLTSILINRESSVMLRMRGQGGEAGGRRKGESAKRTKE